MYETLTKAVTQENEAPYILLILCIFILLVFESLILGIPTKNHQLKKIIVIYGT